MPLSAGMLLGQFQIIEPLGAGAMGEVYLARDKKLGRQVAIKVLPESFSKDPERLSRLEREAKTLASLDHPNIGALYDFEQVDGVFFLVLQLIPGETLAAQIERGPIPIEEALPLFVQVAFALEAAHQQSVVHRDLKPANIKVASNGEVKVLDFGLAKTQPSSYGDSGDDSTLKSSGSLTQDGAILGTPKYMSPEQARAKNVDRRTDIWAFGCTFFEALTGKPPFDGDTTADLVVKILRDTPDWSLLPADTPAIILSILRRCLERDSRRRLKDAGDIAIALEEAQDALGEQVPAAVEETLQKAAPKTSLFLAVAVVLLVSFAGAVWWATRSTPAGTLSEGLTSIAAEPKPVRRFSIGLSEEYPIKRPNPVIGDIPLALSPDGMTLVYVSESGGKAQLIVRRLDQLEAHPIPGSDYAWMPFFSPDGKWIGFQQRGNESPKLMKLPIEGGVPIPLDDNELTFGGFWTDDGRILYGRNLGLGIWEVPEDGGTPELITSVDRAAGESVHAYPQVLPEGKALLYSAGLMPPDANRGRAILFTGAQNESKTLVEDMGRTIYVPSGHIVYPRAGVLMALVFDLETLETVGSEVPVTESRMTTDGAFPRSFTFSADGTMVYIPLDADIGMVRSIVWVDRQGKEEPISLPVRPYSTVRISPNGTRLAVDHIDLEEVWICDLERGSTQRLTFDPASDYRPVWTTDGERVVFLSARLEDTGIFSKRADGVGTVDHLVMNAGYPYPEAISPDGKMLVFRPVASVSPTSYVSMDGNGEPEVLLEGKFNERNVRISPDGKWMSYESAETGRFEVYVQSFPDAGAKWQVSIEGGEEAVWNPDGSELFYWEGVRLMAVDVDVEPTFSASDPQPLFEMPSKVSYDIAPDGERFVVITEGESKAWGTELIVVENWFEELKRLAPTAQNPGEQP